MKNLLLVLSACLITWPAIGQENKSILYTQQVQQPNLPHKQALSGAEMDKMHAASQRFTTQRSMRTTSCIFSGWYNMWDQNYVPGTSVAYSFATYPDSNVVDNTVTTPYNINTHGMGMSFDPTDSSYSYTTVNGGSCHLPISPAMMSDWPYTIDSFYTPVKYTRNNPSAIDSIVIELAVTQRHPDWREDSGTYALQYIPDTAFVPITYDTTPRFISMHYNSGCGMLGAPYNAEPYINDCYFDSVFSEKHRYAFELNSTTVGDTDANGFLDLTKLATGIAGTGALPLMPMSMDYGFIATTYLATFVTFKSGVNYPLGTLISAANTINLYAGEPTGATTWFMQSAKNYSIEYPGSYQAGLIANNQIRYNDTIFTSPYRAHDIAIPSFAYAQVGYPHPAGYDVTEQSFHVVYDYCTLATPARDIISTVTEYPNPASNELNITYSPSNNAHVTITLYNIIGQVEATQTGVNGIATFNTSLLADGIYIYSLQAGGEHVTGHVVVAH